MRSTTTRMYLMEARRRFARLFIKTMSWRCWCGNCDVAKSFFLSRWFCTENIICKRLRRCRYDILCVPQHLVCILWKLGGDSHDFLFNVEKTRTRKTHP